MSDGDTSVNNDATTGENDDSKVEADSSVAISDREAYFQALRMWIQQAQMYQNISTCFPYYMMTFQGFQNNPTNAPLLNNNYQFQGPQFPFQMPNFRPVIENRPPAENLTPAEVIARHGGYEYVIPPLYKRLMAEFIDFILLFILKLIVTFIAVDMFELIDLEKFDFYEFSEHYDDYKYAMELTSEILFLEVIYRILVCIFEAFCLCGSVGRTGGATPGKALLGLRVVTASAIIPVEGRPRDTVLLYPGRPLTFLLALVRSLMKNFLISLLFPLCVVLFVFSHNRTGYDILCGVIVVEENMYPARRHAP
ncbi:PREDICTED: protein FAM8A1 [Papilio polytes]|uniref:protein FAM8A1 n=1 Tax=Papilio polytes TaxID=76194 RepID=UPI0006763A92|nr:PREDICTED: protein FAM8A1 [Papilio polytes]